MQDVAFIKESMIGGVLAKGLAVVYEQKPEKPIDYLAKWLFNYSEMSKTKNTLKQKDTQEQEILQKYDARFNEEQKAKTELQKSKQEKQDKEDAFVQKLHGDEYFIENLNEKIPNYIYEKLNITAAYIGIFDFPSVEIDINNDDFNAHKNLQAQQTFQYIGASDDHKFMLEQSPPQNFLTNKLFQLTDEQDPFDEYVFVPDVTQQKDINFYRIPKLGSYMALPLFLKNYFTEAIFDNALEQRVSYLKNLEIYQNELENLQKTFEQKKAAADPESEDIGAIDAELNQQLEALIKPECPQFQFETKKYVICIDTLSKDTQIDVVDKKYLINFAKEMKAKWEQVQMNILENDIQAQLKYLKSVNVPAEYENLEAKFAFYQEQLLSDEITEYFKVFFQLRTIKFQGILQTVLYLLGYTKDQVNEKGSNLLEWKKFQKEINFELLKKAAEYRFKGAKPAEVPEYAKIQRLQQRQEDLEVIQNYNQGLCVLFKWLQLAMQLRIIDVITRQKDQQLNKENRNLLIQQFEELREKKQNALQAHKDTLGEDLENFDQTAWETEFDTNNAPIEICGEIVDDVDNDVDKIVEEQQQ